MRAWAKNTSDNPLSTETTKLLKSLGLYRSGVSFYALRHTHQTIGDESKDPIAVRYLMGHAEAGADMPAVYRERISDERLRVVTDHIRQWLFETEKNK